MSPSRQLIVKSWWQAAGPLPGAAAVLPASDSNGTVVFAIDVVSALPPSSAAQ
ncbi:MAG: hypothetical protein ABSA02_40575 [Trebonia sp.]